MTRRLLVALVLALAAACGGTAAPTSTGPTSPVGPAALAAPTTTTVPVPVPVAPPADMLNPAVTQDTIGSTICVRGYTTTIRPPASYTEPLKRLQVASYGYADRRLSRYEEDHVVALEIGGAPTTKVNLWPEPHASSVPDDGLEGSLHSQVCSHKITLAGAQAQLYAVKLAHGYQRAKSLA